MEKFKPVKYDLNTSMEVNTPSKWVAGSEPLGAGTQGFTQSIGKMKNRILFSRKKIFFFVKIKFYISTIGS